jgi:hypothetical protein
MEAANDDIDGACRERACHVNGAGELVALDAHEKDNPLPRARDFPRDAVLGDDSVALVPPSKVRVTSSPRMRRSAESCTMA